MLTPSGTPRKESVSRRGPLAAAMQKSWPPSVVRAVAILAIGFALVLLYVSYSLIVEDLKEAELNKERNSSSSSSSRNDGGENRANRRRSGSRRRKGDQSAPAARGTTTSLTVVQEHSRSGGETGPETARPVVFPSQYLSNEEAEFLKADDHFGLEGSGSSDREVLIDRSAKHSYCTYTEPINPRYKKYPLNWDFPVNPMAKKKMKKKTSGATIFSGRSTTTDYEVEELQYSNPQKNVDPDFGPIDGHDCPWKRTVRCTYAGKDVPAEKEKKKRENPPRKGKHLVIYFLHSMSTATLPEQGNWEHFLTYGLLPPGQETHLYDGTDFVIVRSSDTLPVGGPAVTCHEAGNIMLVKVPKIKCDLCAYHLVLKHIGWDPAFSTRLPEYSVWPYKTVTMSNSGTRGPLISPGSSPWVDVVGMAGQRTRPLLFNKEELSFKTIAASSISFQGQVHAQSFFLTIPLSAIEFYSNLYKASCHVSHKAECIGKVELETINGLMKLEKKKRLKEEEKEEEPFSWYSLIQNITMPANYPGGGQALLKDHGLQPTNPTHEYTDPCRALFLKFGGASWEHIKARTKREVALMAQVMKQFKPIYRNSKRNNNYHQEANRKEGRKGSSSLYPSRLLFFKNMGRVVASKYGDEAAQTMMKSSFPKNPKLHPSQNEQGVCNFWGNGTEFDFEYTDKQDPGAWILHAAKDARENEEELRGRKFGRD